METDHKLFVELTKEEKLKLIEAYLDGEEIERKSFGGTLWEPHPSSGSVKFSENVYYRRKTIEPVLPWDDVSDVFNYCCLNAYNQLTFIDSLRVGYRIIQADVFKRFKPGVNLPKGYIAARPGFEEK